MSAALAEYLATFVAELSDGTHADRERVIVFLFNSARTFAESLTREGLECTADEIEDWCAEQVGHLPLVLDFVDAVTDALKTRGSQLTDEQRRTAEKLLAETAEIVKTLGPSGASS